MTCPEPCDNFESSKCGADIITLQDVDCINYHHHWCCPSLSEHPSSTGYEPNDFWVNCEVQSKCNWMVERNEIYILKLIVKCNQSGIKWLKGIKYIIKKNCEVQL